MKLPSENLLMIRQYADVTSVLDIISDVSKYISITFTYELWHESLIFDKIFANANKQTQLTSVFAKELAIWILTSTYNLEIQLSYDSNALGDLICNYL